MCGICGVWNIRADELVGSMLERMNHRGPDENGILIAEKGSLGHSRLSIMDPEHGKQPIYSEDGSRAVIANGEIYNFPALYEELKGKHTFRTKNDSEVLLHLYEEYGPKMVEKIEGMFAFCIKDGDELFVARDHIGIKPLYYGFKEDGTFLFTSELKTYDGNDYPITEFPPGTWYSSEAGFRRFYEVPYVETIDAPEEIHIREVRDCLERAVEKRLMSDVPLGTFLSGGLDSSIISALVAKRIDGLHTFSVGLPGSGDLPAAEAVADHIGSSHHTYILDPKEILAKLPDIIYHLESFDQDLVRSAVPCYFTSRMAAEYVKVIHTGEGADELFGGYTYYKDIDEEDILHRELIRSVSTLHNINLQRVDRMTMAHSLEGRVPFLDCEMIEVGQRVPAELKLKGDPPMEKWVLRKAFEHILPYEIVWRRKKQFDEGTGISEAMPALVDEVMSDAEADSIIEEYSSFSIRSKEESYYFKIFIDSFSDRKHIIENVARWAERPEFV
ncbi:MAG: asparagine synthase B [Spirochaetia bacterium]